MDKKFLSTAIAAIVGLAAFTLIGAAVSFLFEAVSARDLANITELSSNMEGLVYYIRNTAIGIVVFSAAAIATYFFTYFTKLKKVFACIAAILSLALAVFAIAFIFDLRGIALASASETMYTAAASYFGEFISFAVSALILCAYFTVVTVKEFTAKPAPKEALAEETTNVETEPKEEERNEAD